MDTVLLIIGILLFAAWITGLIVSLPGVWRKLFGNNYPIRKSFPVNRKKAY